MLDLCCSGLVIVGRVMCAFPSDNRFVSHFCIILKKDLNTWCDFGLNLHTAFRAEISAPAVCEIDLCCENFFLSFLCSIYIQWVNKLFISAVVRLFLRTSAKALMAHEAAHLAENFPKYLSRIGAVSRCDSCPLQQHPQ